MKSKAVKVLSIFFVFYAVSSCTDKERWTKVIDKVERYYMWVEQDKKDSVFSLFNEKFFSQVDSVRLVEILNDRTELGRIASRNYLNTSQETKYSEGEKTMHISVKYRVKYNNGKVFDEAFEFLTNDEFTDRLIRIKFDERH